MADKIKFLSPAAEAWRPLEATVPRLDNLRGARVAILNNRWTSMNIISEQIAIILKEQYGVAEVFEKLKTLIVFAANSLNFTSPVLAVQVIPSVLS